MMSSPYLSSRIIARIAGFCVAHAWKVAGGAMLLLIAAVFHVITAMDITTDPDALISPNLPYRKAEAAFRQVFPSARSNFVVVIDGQTPELAESAAQQISSAMQARPDLFNSVRRPDGGEFFAANGLLFLPKDEVIARTDQLLRAQPFLGPLAYDPSLRGVMATFASFAQGVSLGEASLQDLERPITALKPPLDAAIAGNVANFSWRALFSDAPPSTRDLRKMVLADPVLDHAKLKSAQAPTAFVREMAAKLNAGPDQGARVRLTGPALLADEEFATLAENAGLTSLLMVGAITLMLWLATHSARTIFCILLTTMTGLSSTAAVGLMLFGRFNAISLAFIPLFVGLGIDFGIQLAVRFRADQRDQPSLDSAIIHAAGVMGRSLALAAAAIAVGFLAFVPTQYSGISQLGAIAGLGMVIALVLSLTMLPALLKLTAPRGALIFGRETWLTQVDAYVLSKRRYVLGFSALAAAVCFALSPLLPFDFNPLHLRSAKTESVSTLLDLSRDPLQSPDAINIIAPNLEKAQALSARLAQLPQVDRVVSLARFVPADQDEKLLAIQDANDLLGPSLSPFELAPPPNDAEEIAAILDASAKLRAAAGAAGTESEAAKPALALAETLEALAKAPVSARQAAGAALIAPLNVTLEQVRASLEAQPVSLETLPPDLTRQWLAPDGRARLAIIPKGDTNSNTVREDFAAAVRALVPEASGPPIAQIEAGRIVVGAFITAGILSFLAITALLFLALRRPGDVLITMTPIILTGLLTIGSAVLLKLPLNFANIIALPLLFGMGVAFHIYFVMAWREGEGHLLDSSLARGVFFSALSSATGFGSLWLSSHPGTASMGQLLMISLLWTIVSALLFQPALMGAAPKDRGSGAGESPA